MRGAPTFTAVMVLVLAGCGSAPSVAPSSSRTSLTAAAPASPAPTVAPGADASGCPLVDDGNLAVATALDRNLVLADGRTIELATAGMQARNGNWAADDAIPQFATLELKMDPVRLAPGKRLVIAGSPGMTFTGGTARAWRRSQLSGAGVSVKGKPRGLASKVVNGKLRLALPGAGTWVVEIGPEWETPCLTGDGVAYAVVAVR
jgi:hypothetical protein